MLPKGRSCRAHGAVLVAAVVGSARGNAAAASLDCLARHLQWNGEPFPRHLAPAPDVTPALHREYAMTPELVAESLWRSPGAVGPGVAAALEKLRTASGEVVLGVIGGSFAAGVGCNDGEHVWADCGYAARVRRWLAAG